MNTLRVLSALFKVNVQMSLAYRTDTIVNILLNLFWLGWELLGLDIIFSNTSSLGGWGFGELIALLGVFRLVSALMSALIWPNTEQFNTSVRDGTLDYTLLKPVNSLFLVTFSRMVIWRVWDLVLSAALIIVGVHISGGHTTIPDLMAFLLLASTGSAILYSLWVVMLSATFWFVKFDNNVTILSAMVDTGRYPATVYPGWLRLVVTFVVPVAVATTIPVQALRGDLSFLQVILYAGVALVTVLVATRIWKAGIRHYSGASS